MWKNSLVVAASALAWFLAVWALPSQAAPVSLWGSSNGGVICPFATSDACGQANQFGFFRPATNGATFAAYAKQSGQYWPNPHPQTWNVAGVDYPLGYDSRTVFKDPTKLGVITGEVLGGVLTVATCPTTDPATPTTGYDIFKSDGTFLGTLGAGSGVCSGASWSGTTFVVNNPTNSGHGASIYVGVPGCGYYPNGSAALVGFTTPFVICRFNGITVTAPYLAKMYGWDFSQGGAGCIPVDLGGTFASNGTNFTLDVENNRFARLGPNCDHHQLVNFSGGNWNRKVWNNEIDGGWGRYVDSAYVPRTGIGGDQGSSDYEWADNLPGLGVADYRYNVCHWNTSRCMTGIWNGGLTYQANWGSEFNMGDVDPHWESVSNFIQIAAGGKVPYARYLENTEVMSSLIPSAKGGPVTAMYYFNTGLFSTVISEATIDKNTLVSNWDGAHVTGNGALMNVRLTSIDTLTVTDNWVDPTGQGQCVVYGGAAANITGAQSGTTLTVTSIKEQSASPTPGSPLIAGMALFLNGPETPTTTIVNQLSSSEADGHFGGTGVYTVNTSMNRPITNWSSTAAINSETWARNFSLRNGGAVSEGPVPIRSNGGCPGSTNDPAIP